MELKIVGLDKIWYEKWHGVHASRPSVHLVLPPVVAVGSSATLLCLFDLENDPLYSVKWYRGNFEFYRYVPKERPPGRAFSFPGLFVDLSLSNDQQVSLLDVQLHLAGKFSCEVSADAPFFTTITVSDRLRVIDLRDLSPEIFVEEIFSENDHFLHANCTSHHSKPPPELTFFINNIAVSREYVQTWSNGVALQINLTLLSPSRHEFTIKCVASVLGSHHLGLGQLGAAIWALAGQGASVKT
uniref:Ig-like domain-containing protein n=1 Tax=Timema tahoe TaxID=61484 RepID=A0A7R9FN07_9NEOP|nr:unnamed protein product [Timema tahoe]